MGEAGCHLWRKSVGGAGIRSVLSWRLFAVLLLFVGLMTVSTGAQWRDLPDDFLDVDGDTMRGNIDMGTSLNNITNFFQDTCGTDEYVARIWENGSYVCQSDETGGIPDDQNLSEVLVQGNVANQSINMSQSNIEWIGDANFDSTIDLNSDGGTKIEIGDGASTFSSDMVVVGANAGGSGNAQKSVAIGSGANPGSQKSNVIIGNQAGVDDGSADQNAVGIGENSVVSLRGVTVGSQAITTGDDAIAIGRDANATANGAVAIGGNAGDDGPGFGVGTDSVTVGENAAARGYQSVAIGDDVGSFGFQVGREAIGIGPQASAGGSQAIALGVDTTAAGAAAVAIGNQSTAPNQYEATFGNLQGEQLDVNVTGNMTVHGLGGLRFARNVTIGNSTTRVTNPRGIAIGRGTQAGEVAVGLGYQADANWRGVAVGEGATSGNQGTVVGQSAGLSGSKGVAVGRDADGGGQSVVVGYRAVASAGAVALGQRAGLQGSGTDSVAIGENTNALGYESVAIGDDVGLDDSNVGREAIGIGPQASAGGDQSIGIGADANASGPAAVAVGNQSTAPNQYEATFGNLQGEALDVNVTGNVTVHRAARFDRLFGDSSNAQCGTDEFLNGEGDCTPDSTGGSGSTETLDATLTAGNAADGQDIVMNGTGADIDMKNNTIQNVANDTDMVYDDTDGRVEWRGNGKEICIGNC